MEVGNESEMAHEEVLRRALLRLVHGAVFLKHKYGETKRRLLWCSIFLDRIMWGSTKKKAPKGHLIRDEIREIGYGSKISSDFSALSSFKSAGTGDTANNLKLIIHSQSRKLNLEAQSQLQYREWIRSLNMWIKSSTEERENFYAWYMMHWNENVGISHTLAKLRSLAVGNTHLRYKVS